MNIKTLKKVLPILFTENITPFLWGNQGIGKTQSVSQLADELGYGFVHLNFATQEVGDLVGLLDKRTDGTVHHLRPNWMPKDEDGPHIIFMDELNRSHPDVIQALFSLITERRIHQHKLGSQCYLVAAGNYNNEKFTVTDTSDSAWNSRFCHIDVTPSVEEWIDYVASIEGSQDVVDFIREMPSHLESTKRSGLDTSFIQPDRRSWTNLIKLDRNENLNNEGIKYELFQGLVGSSSAAAYQSWKVNKEKNISLDEILKDFSKAEVKLSRLMSRAKSEEVRLDVINQPLNELIHRIEFKASTVMPFINNVKKFVLFLPSEASINFLKKLDSLKPSDIKEDEKEVFLEIKEELTSNYDFVNEVLNKLSSVSTKPKTKKKKQ